MIHTLAISGYRSIRDLVLPLEKLTVITGANGSGKSSLYRSIRLLADVAQGRVISALAHEGGLESTLWAGPETISRAMKSGEHPVQGTRRKGPVALRLGFADEDYGYAIDLGLPIPTPGGSMFDHDPEIKAEALWAGDHLKRSNTLASRAGPAVQVLDDDGRRRVVARDLPGFDSMMTRAADSGNGAELLVMRERMRAWRFYDHLRTDRDAPARTPQVGTRTVSLAGDGRDLAAAIQTIREIGDGGGLDAAVGDAFPGASLDITVREGLFAVVMRQPGLLRPLSAAELSDGTLRYLLLVAALMTPRPPPLMVLNEPETSLHPDLLPPLARMIAAAASRTQVIVVSHARLLVEALVEQDGCVACTLEKELGETVARGAGTAPWEWPAR